MINLLRNLRRRPFFIRLFHWEYWSFSTVYVPIYPVWIFLCIRARSFFFFAASNPTIRNGGFLNESKKDIIPLIPEEFHPRTLFFSLPANVDVVINQLTEKGMGFPLIGKPDIGGRGRGVMAMRNENDVRAFVKKAYIDFHIQEFVQYKQEAGIFYYRFPGHSTGKISGIVRKEFLKITGNGTQSFEALILKNDRAILQLPVLKKLYADQWNRILDPGEEIILVPYGNHARGAMFLDDSHLADETLRETMDRICKKIPGFYFGRLDIRFRNWEELKAGKNFYIIEVNGAGSEPTHIYDPAHSLFFAWKEIIRHWILLWKISRANHKRGYGYLSLSEGIRMFREDKQWSEKLKAMGEE